MMSKPHVLIVGAGLGGLTLAQVLRKKGVTFEIFERDASEASRAQGWSLAIHSVLQDLKELTPEDLPPLEESVRALQGLDLNDQLLLYFNHERIGVPSTTTFPWIRANRSRLRLWLSHGLDIQWNKTARKIEQAGDKVTVTFQDGSNAVGDILVGADGTNSAVREHALGKSNKETLEYLPISTICGETILSGEAFLRQLEVAHSVALIGVSPMDLWSVMLQAIVEVLPDQRSAKYYWILAWHNPITLYNGSSHVDSISAEERLALARHVTKDLDPKLQHMLNHAKPSDLRTGAWVPRDGVVDSLPVSRVTLLGDAAHPTSPFRGEGGVHALQDALKLGKLIGAMESSRFDCVHQAFAAYQDEMVPRGAAMVKSARSQLSLYRNDLLAAGVRVIGHEPVKLPKETLEFGSDGVCSVPVQ
ncbi:hypothetical protein F5Y15DRAFT_386605 [Xylariaceae sp. FL0016]|nr:hypothetical protein F5Y15DRAFT_386605 [Xylariaceae sp. FL0016]